MSEKSDITYSWALIVIPITRKLSGRGVVAPWGQSHLQHP